MRKTYIFIIAALLMAACSKERTVSGLTARSLTGTWELRAISGGMMANPPAILPGNGDKWVFTTTSYERYFKDTLYERGDYLIRKGTGTDPNTPRKVDELLLGQQGSLNVELVNDTLKFFYGPIAADGYISHYVQIR